MEVVETGIGGEPCEIVLVVIPILKKLFYYVYVKMHYTKRFFLLPHNKSAVHRSGVPLL